MLTTTYPEKGDNSSLRVGLALLFVSDILRLDNMVFKCMPDSVSVPVGSAKAAQSGAKLVVGYEISSMW